MGTASKPGLMELAMKATFAKENVPGKAHYSFLTGQSILVSLRTMTLLDLALLNLLMEKSTKVNGSIINLRAKES